MLPPPRSKFFSSAKRSILYLSAFVANVPSLYPFRYTPAPHSPSYPLSHRLGTVLASPHLQPKAALMADFAILSGLMYNLYDHGKLLGIITEFLIFKGGEDESQESRLCARYRRDHLPML